MADNPMVYSIIQKIPLTFITDLLCALHTARDVVMLRSAEGTVIVGNNLCELLCSLMDYHPEPIVRNWIKNELRNLDQGKQIW